MQYTKNDYMTIEIFERLNAQMMQAGARLGIEGIVPLDLSQGAELIPTAEFINQIEQNLKRLGAANTKTWYGEDKDEVWLNYQDVNRWFASIT